MAFPVGTLAFIINEVLPKVKTRNRVLCLARQRVTSPTRDIADFLVSSGFPDAGRRLENVHRVTSLELFDALGFQHYEDVDFTGREGAAIVHDMNDPLPEPYHDRYDLVFEMGTMEHIFNIKTTFENIIKALKVGGVVCHLSPLNLINHGFYNFSPTLFYDVYRSNGFTDLDLFLADFPLRWWKNPNFNYKKIDFTPGRIIPESPKKYFPLICCTAVKETRLDAFRTPIQAVYDPALGLEPIF